MAQLSIEELNEIVQGQVTLGSTAAARRPVGPAGSDRLRQPPRAAWRRVLGLARNLFDGSYFAEEALMRAAQGTWWRVDMSNLGPAASAFVCQTAGRHCGKLGQWSRLPFWRHRGAASTTADHPRGCWRWTRHVLSQRRSQVVAGDCRGDAKSAQSWRCWIGMPTTSTQ